MEDVAAIRSNVLLDTSGIFISLTRHVRSSLFYARRFHNMSDTEMPTSRVANPVAVPVVAFDPDTALVKRFLAGDTHAFKILFKKYQRPIFNFVSRMVPGEDANDLTQDVFCNALRGLRRFRGDSKFSTWLYSIARNVCLNNIRHDACSREESLEAITEKHPNAEFQDESIDVQAITETHEIQAIVNSVLARLSPEHRLLITLRDFEQLSYEEIALITEMSLSNVKSRLHRARIAFKNKFKPYLPLLAVEP